jgi:hypothetical protein
LLSRSETWIVLAAIIAGLAAAPAAAQDQAGSAQDQTDSQVGALITQQRETYTPPPAPRRDDPCGVDTDNGITVCGAEDPERYRLHSESGDDGTAQGKKGVHVVPGGVTARACLLQKCPKPLYLIDLKSIPVAPAGSDADKIAKGEMRAP